MADSKNETTKKSTVRTVIISLILVTAAILVGLLVANLIKDRNTPDSAAEVTPTPADAAVPQATGYNSGKTSMLYYAKDVFKQFWNDTFHKDETTGEDDPAADMPLNSDRDYGLEPAPVLPDTEDFSQIVSLSPMNLIYDYDPETGHIYNMLLEVMLCSSCELHYIYIPTEVTYIMSAATYRTLSNSNITVPKIVTYSHLYEYYGNDKAFDAGRQILSDQLGYTIPFYTAVEHERFEDYIMIRNDNGSHSLRMPITPAVARSELYGTAGSYSGIIGSGLEGAVTNWPAAARLRYLDTYDSMSDNSVHFLDASVILKNETSELDVLPIMKYLEKILY